MTGSEYQKEAARTINNDMTSEEKKNHALLGMASEVGEILGIYQKRYQGHTVDRAHIKKEIGDELWFIAELCTALDIDLDDVMQVNINKLYARYPNGFEENRSIHRREGDI